jgi:glycosyltransferase involved in cell wall biosynthesis
MTTGHQPIRVLHVIGGMVRGGIETWLMHVLRHAGRDQVRMDFLVHSEKPGSYDDEVRALGGRIIPCSRPSRYWAYARQFRRILHEYGPYDVVHSHVHHFNGFVLRLARQGGVPVRVAHSHVGVMPVDVTPGLLRRVYLGTARRWIRRQATAGFAASRLAGDALFGEGWSADPRWGLLYYGIDLEPFRGEPDRSVRAELGLPADALVIGHVGRFEEQKNHRFLLEIMRCAVDREPRSRLLLIGTGALRSAIERRVAELGLEAHVMFAGLRSDVPRVLRAAVDVFVMPSLCEGLPVAGLEAQAAGLPCVLADTITRELAVVPQLVTWRSLADPPERWVEAVLAVCDHPRPASAGEALATIEDSLFNIRRGVRELERRYRSALA